MDDFFYAGQGDLNTEIEADIRLGLAQMRRSLFYNRSYGGGIANYENNPGGGMLQIVLKYEAMKVISLRNQRVGNGSTGGRDYRAAASQRMMEVLNDGKGEVSFNVRYIPLHDISQKGSSSIPLGGS